MGRRLTSHDVESNQDEQSSAWRDWATVLTWSVVGYIFIVLTIISYFNPALLPLDMMRIVFNKDVSPFFAFSQGSGHFTKPHGFKIVALVPFQYHERTEILDCYLQVGFVIVMVEQELGLILSPAKLDPQSWFP